VTTDPGTGKRRRPRVLVADDHDDMREAFAWCMRAAGWSVDEVTNGAEALALAAALAPDVIVLDLHMPVIDGIEAMRRLRKDPRTARIPVVACTAFGHLHEIELQDAGFDDLVLKPCSPEELQAALEDAVASRGSQASEPPNQPPSQPREDE
jgi:CheY-like chemotaxis protein